MLTAATVQYRYPIRRVEECLDSLKDATVFSTLNTNSVYWQIEVEDANPEKLTFIFRHGLDCFTKISFPSRNADETFPRTVKPILSSIKYRSSLVYLEYVFVFSKTLPNHTELAWSVMTLSRDAGVAVNLKKYEFLATPIDNLGHVTRPGCLKISSYTF